MSRRTTSRWLRSVRIAAVASGVLMGVLAGSPAHASDIPDWPDGSWATCADAETQYCIQDATVTPVDGVATPVADLGLHASASTLGGYVRSFNWSIDGWEGADVPQEVRDGDVNLVLRTGQFMPRYTFALARGMRVVRSTDDNGNTTMTITGHAVHIDWTTGDLFASCVAGWDCGGPDTMADPIGTGYRYMGNTQDLEVWGQDAIDTYDGMYLASDAQARPIMVNFNTYPEPYWSLQVLGNPHLDMNGDPVRGSFNAWLPPAYFAKTGTTPEDAAAVGFDVISRDGDAATSVPATVALQDGGVGIDVADLGYSVHHIDVYSRPSSALPGATVPGEPREVRATAGDGAVHVDWAAPAADGGSSVTGYTVRAFSAAVGGTIAARCSATTTSCTIDGLVNGTTYYLAASASNAFGEGRAASERIAATATEPIRTVPSEPRAVALIAGNGTLAASWQAPESTGGSPVTGYTVKAFSSADGGEPVTTCTAISVIRACTLTGLTNGTGYYVAVTAVNAVGTGPDNVRVLATPRTIPSAASALAVVPGDGSLRVTWNPPLSNGGSAITRYTVAAYRTADGGAAVRTCTVAAPSRTCNLTPLANGTMYYVTVTAANVAGPSREAPRVSAAPRTTPSAVRSVSAVNMRGKIRATWTEPTSNGGSSVIGYQIAVYGSLTATTPVARCTTAASARSCTTVNLPTHRTYYTTVTAFNAAGQSAPSSRVAVYVHG